jgi:hypothetical protein
MPSGEFGQRSATLADCYLPKNTADPVVSFPARIDLGESRKQASDIKSLIMNSLDERQENKRVQTNPLAGCRHRYSLSFQM